MTTLYAASYVSLAVVQVVTYLAIVARHAIPRSPRVFHVALTAPMWAGVVLLFMLATLVSTGSGELFGLEALDYMTFFIWTETSWLSVLLYYAYWWYRHGRNEPSEQFDRIERALTDAASERTGDRPMEETDRAEGRKHRAVIEGKFDADRDELAEERQLDREERAQERQDDRDERRDERGRDARQEH